MPFFKTLIEGPIPRRQLYFLVPISAFVLISLFVYLGFPYDQLAANLSSRIAESTGTDVRIDGISPRITIAGPGFDAEQVQIVTSSDQSIRLGPVGVRPAWSTSWLRGRPALHVDVESGYGNASGMVIVSSLPGFDGHVSEVDLERLPVPPGMPVSLRGRLTGDANLMMTEEGPDGTVHFEATSGSLVHDALPMAIDFETLTGDLVFGGKYYLDVQSARLDGPLLSASANGKVGKGATPAQRKLDMALDLQINRPNIVLLIQGIGVPINSDGRASFDLGGTMMMPRMK